MTNLFRFVCVLAVSLGVAACVTHDNKLVEAESLVDKSRWTIRHFENREDEAARDFRRMLGRAKGVVIFPNVVKGGFFVGAEGGSGVMLARDPNGEWGYPAFYTMGAGSFGLQIGAQASEVVLLLMSDQAIEAVIAHQGKLGGDVQATAGNLGAGLEGATTSNIGGDIVGYAAGSGLFFGASIEGAVLGRRNDLNEAYYGTAVGPREIVLERRSLNPQADPLRDALAGIAAPMPAAVVPLSPEPAS